MNYDLNEEQNMLRESANKFLAGECSTEFVRAMIADDKGFTPELWEKMAELGWMGLPIPEEYGGSDMDFFDLAILLSEMGRVCLPGPFFSTVVLGALTILEAGSDEQKKNILPDIADGARKLTLAWLEEGGSWTPEGINLAAKPKGDGYILSGTKLFAPYAHVADTIIVAARTGDGPADISLFLVDAGASGVSVTVLNTLGGDKQCEVVFENVAVSGADVLGEIGKGWPVLERTLLMSAVAKSAETIGAAEYILTTAVEYAKVREQFGRAVGAFQAVQHHCANMLTYADTNKFMTYEAAWRIASGLSFAEEASICKAWVTESHRKLVSLGHQVLGGIGFMEEHDLHLYSNRAKASEQMFGDSDFHRELLAREMGL